MPGMTGRLAVLLGGDGSGKSSVLQRLREQRPQWQCASIDPADLYPLPGLDYMNWALETPPRTYIKAWGPIGRATFLAHVMGLCYEERIHPALAAGRTVVCDSYHYRIWAKEQMLGSAGADVVAALGAALRPPDLLVWLGVDPITAWHRNGQSCQAYEAVGGRTFEGFRAMQEGVRRLVLEAVSSLPLTLIDANRPLSEVTADVAAAVAGLAPEAAER